MTKTKTLIADSPVLNTMQLIPGQPSSTGTGVSLYSFYVINVATTKIEKSFGFDIPPQSITMEESAAAEAIPLQEGSYYTDERGQYFKNVTIAGTFGFRPTPKSRVPGALDTIFDINRSIDQVQDAFGNLLGESFANQGFPVGERTGWMRYRDLHNIIRFYWEMKGKKNSAADYLFVFANWKTGEVYVAQPLQFRRSRQAPGGRFKRSYDLSLRLLAPLDVSRGARDFLPKPNRDLQYWATRMRAAVGVVDAAVAFAVRSANSAINFGGDFINSGIFGVREIKGSILSAVLEPTATFTRQVRAISDNVQDIGAIPPNIPRQLVRDYMTIKGAFEAEGYRDVGNAYSRLARGVSELHVAVQVTHLKGTLNEDVRTYANAYRQSDSDTRVNLFGEVTTITSTADRGSGTGLTPGVPEGVRTIPLPGKMTIKDVALSLLGSAGRWKEIAILNRLDAPYISPKGDGKTVLRPGDLIKIPEIPDDEDESNQVFSLEDNVNDLDASRYGRDLKVNLESKDLEVDESGDLATIEGLENLRQAMHIKVWTKPGDLKVHPTFGFGARAGQGLSIDVLSSYHLQARATLLSDTRIQEVRYLSVRAAGDIAQIRAVLIPKEKDDSIDLTLRSRIG